MLANVLPALAADPIATLRADRPRLSLPDSELSRIRTRVRENAESRGALAQR